MVLVSSRPFVFEMQGAIVDPPALGASPQNGISSHLKEVLRRPSLIVSARPARRTEGLWFLPIYTACSAQLLDSSSLPQCRLRLALILLMSSPPSMIDFTQDLLSTLVDVSKFIIFMEIILLLLSGIYGGIVPTEGTSESLITPSGFRKDVLHLIRDELKVPIVRWPGGNFVRYSVFTVCLL
jgi:hypothetical protein